MMFHNDCALIGDAIIAEAGLFKKST